MRRTGGLVLLLMAAMAGGCGGPATGGVAPSDSGWELAVLAAAVGIAQYIRSMRTSVVFDDEVADEARRLGINVSEAAREGLREAIRRRRAERDRDAYLARPETEDTDWDDVEAWGNR